MAMFQPELINLSVAVETETELFEVVAKRLKQLGYVNEGYLAGIKQREEQFPTGLITQYVNIALPHSEVEFVEKPFIFITRIETPVTVRQMGDNQEMAVRNFLFLGIKEPSKQVGLLQELMVLFQQERFVEQFIATMDESAMYQLFSNQFQVMEGVKHG